MGHLRVGNQLDKATDMGAVVDESQRKSVEEFVESARQDGADVSFRRNCYLFNSSILISVT